MGFVREGKTRGAGRKWKLERGRGGGVAGMSSKKGASQDEALEGGEEEMGAEMRMGTRMKMRRRWLGGTVVSVVRATQGGKRTRRRSRIRGVVVVMSEAGVAPLEKRRRRRTMRVGTMAFERGARTRRRFAGRTASSGRCPHGGGGGRRRGRRRVEVSERGMVRRRSIVPSSISGQWRGGIG